MKKPKKNTMIQILFKPKKNIQFFFTSHHRPEIQK